ncbi:TPA: J domain-containing protein [Legionella pneumophila]|nr:hypothetical protein [Legionella pneumophila]
MGNIATTIQCSVNEPSKAQKRFNTLSKGLKQDKELLQKWVETHSQLKMELADKLIPLAQEIEALKLNALVLLDKNYENKTLTDRQREKLHTFIQYLTDICLNFDSSGVAEEIHDKYNEVSIAEINKATEDAMKSELEELFGVDLGEDFDFSSESAYADFMGAVNEKQGQESASKKTKKGGDKYTPSKVKKKSDNEIMESKSIKEVFRQLTKVLHPDREMDEEKKAKKSELMKRANQAYKNNDIFTLLELQFEIEQIEQKELNNLAHDKLLAYNRMLQRQRKKIKEEIEMLKHRISHEMEIPPFYRSPEDAFFYLNREVLNMKASKSKLSEDLEIFSDIKSLKRWLNVMKKSDMPVRRNEQGIIDAIMEDIFEF